jgi:hypothetical protein
VRAAASRRRPSAARLTSSHLGCLVPGMGRWHPEPSGLGVHPRQCHLGGLRASLGGYVAHGAGDRMVVITRFALEAGIADAAVTGIERARDIPAEVGVVAPNDVQEPRLSICANRVRGIHLQPGDLLWLPGERDAAQPHPPRGVLAEDAGLLAGRA